MVLAEKFPAIRFRDGIRRHGRTAFGYIGTIVPVRMKAPPGEHDRGHPPRMMTGAGAGNGLFEVRSRRRVLPPGGVA